MKSKFIYVICLVIYICIFLGITFYDETTVKNIGILRVNTTDLKISDGIYDGKYISKNDTLANFNKNVFYDKIARKLIITSWDNVLKIKNDEACVIRKDNDDWYEIDDIASKLGYKALFDYKHNNKNIYNYEEIDAKVKKIRTELYDTKADKVIGVLDNIKSVQILVDDLAYNDESKYINVKITENDLKTAVGKVEKQALEYDIAHELGEKESNENIIMTIVENSLSQETDLNIVNTLAYEMFRINSESTVIEEEYVIQNKLTQDIYGIINNGYKIANFDANILSRIVQSDVSKENIIKQIEKYTIDRKLNGIVVDFKKFKTTDKELITQFIKEMSATLHGNGKKVILKMTDISTYDIESIKDFVDYIIVGAHSARTTSSKISGSHSSINYVRNLLETFVNVINKEKIILEIAPYSILWTERAGTVINAEVFTMNVCTQYISTNNLITQFDKNSGQNIINYTKGIITYKMWLEDETSIAIKNDIAKEKDIAGICVYKSGYETKDIYKVIDFKEE